MDTVVVLTALPVESAAVRDLLSGLTVVRHETGTIFEVGETADGRRVALAETGGTNVSTAVIADRAITTFRPRALFFVGVAGALKDDIGLGDVVVATSVYAYQGGKVTDDGFLARPQGWKASHDLEQLARLVVRSPPWSVEAAGDAVRVHFKPIAAGDVVLDSRTAPVARLLHDNYNDAAAIEMESAGAAEAGHLNRGLSMLAVRGISDLADGAKSLADADGWQPRAAAHAAAFVVALIAELLPPYTRSGPHAGSAYVPGPPSFSDRLDAPPGPLVLGFGHDDTVVVVDRKGSVFRWSLREQRRIRGASVGRTLGYSFLGIANTALVATGRPTVAVMSERQLTLVHFDEDVPRTSTLPLAANEFLTRPGGISFATYTKNRVLVRTFADGAVQQELACGPSAATPALDFAGTTVATSTSNRITIAELADVRPRQVAIDNIPSAGCQVAFSPAGDLLAYASLKEVGFVDAATGEVVRRRSLSWRQTAMSLGAARLRLVCAPGGEVFLLLRGTLVRIRWDEPEFHHLAPDDRYDDLAIDPTGRYLAAVTDRGRLDVWHWPQ